MVREGRDIRFYPQRQSSFDDLILSFDVINFQSAIFSADDLRRQGSIHPHIDQCECFDITIKMLLSNGVQYLDGDPFTVSEALMRLRSDGNRDTIARDDVASLSSHLSLMSNFVTSKMKTLVAARKQVDFSMSAAMDGLLNWSKGHFIGRSGGSEDEWRSLNLRGTMESVLKSSR
jgi:hypothetical protein